MILSQLICIMQSVLMEVSSLTLTILGFSSRAWIDLVDDSKWHFSGEITTFLKWGDNEPNTDLEACTVMYASGMWHDYLCSSIFNYICERNMNN